MPMKVIDTFMLKGRGQLIFVALDGPEPTLKSKLRRVGDGAEWSVRGIEWYAIPRRPGKDDKVGILLEGEKLAHEDDEIVRVEAQKETT